MLRKLKGAGHCTSAKRMTSILRHVAEAFPPALCAQCDQKICFARVYRILYKHFCSAISFK